MAVRRATRKLDILHLLSSFSIQPVDFNLMFHEIVSQLSPKSVDKSVHKLVHIGETLIILPTPTKWSTFKFFFDFNQRMRNDRHQNRMLFHPEMKEIEIHSK